jgi:hypothetical protein
MKGVTMFISNIVKKIVKNDGKTSIVAKKIAKLKNSKEFHYLVDVTR